MRAAAVSMCMEGVKSHGGLCSALVAWTRELIIQDTLESNYSFNCIFFSILSSVAFKKLNEKG